MIQQFLKLPPKIMHGSDSSGKSLNVNILLKNLDILSQPTVFMYACMCVCIVKM